MRSKIAIAAVAAAGLALFATACSSGNGFGSSSASSAASAKPNKSTLTLMFGSSGPAETAAVQAAAKAYTKQSGIPVQVIPASALTQQVAQAFSGGTPPSVFYLDPLTFQSYAKDGVLDAYPSSLPNASGFASALSAAFTYKSTLTCEPKDASTLALYINTTDWQQAGLGAPPANWSQLEADAKKLTTGSRAGLTIDQQEMTFSKAFGVIPSLTSAQAQYAKTYPQFSTFVDELSYAHPDIAIAGATQALSAFDSSLEQLASSSPATILKTAQQNLQAVVNQDS